MMTRILLYFFILCGIASCTFTRGKHTYENMWNIPPQTSIAINSTSKDTFPMVLYNKSKDNTPLKVVIKDNSSSKIIAQNDSLSITAPINKGITISNTGKGNGAFRIKIFNHNGSVKENRQR